ncbi:hypothetical protein [Nitrosophilus labii]|uniref:hypothetical protein n=1 Tax=Nitrosophilus labii TaxID=2706014 RepID=UPI00165760E4|nr:hypothetical protein [Nitrosophilus labii]
MLKFVFIPILLLNLYCEEINLGIRSDSLYLSYHDLPKKIFVNQIFPVTIKIIVTEEVYKNLSYNFENTEGIIPISSDIPERQEGIYIYKTFYFKALTQNIRLPDITVYLLKDNYSPLIKDILPGKSIKAIKLNPPKDFCNVLANSLEMKNFQAIQYDKDQNLIVINIEANLSNLEDFHLDFAVKEGIEEIYQNFPLTSITYFAIVPSYLKNFKFSFFNLSKNKFEHISREIEVKDETVSTQSDIRPSESSHKTIKIIIFLSISTFFLIIALFKKSFFYLFIAFIFGGYGAYLSIPLKTVCVKENSKVSLLPTKNSTVFFITDYNFKTKRLNHTNGYTKIELPNGKIGWVKDEDLCEN